MTDASVAVEAEESGSSKKQSDKGRLLSSLLRDKYALVSAVVLVILAFTAFFAEWVAPYDPTDVNIIERLTPPAIFSDGKWEYLLGTDLLGRDLLSRIIYGTRMSLLIGVSVVFFSGVFGTVIGMAAGYLGGRFDAIVMRFVDFQAAIPYFLLALTIMAAIGPGARNLVIVLSLISWPIFARYSRGIMLSVKREVYIEAARVSGCSEIRILLKHAFPNLASPIVTLSTLELSRIILSEAGLSFLGLGVQPPDSAWGLMVAEAHDYVSTANWTVTLPGLMVMITTLSINIFATWLRRATDPVQRGRM